MTNITNVFEFWDLIETCCFQENTDDIINDDDNYKVGYLDLQKYSIFSGPIPPAKLF